MIFCFNYHIKMRNLHPLFETLLNANTTLKIEGAQGHDH